MFFTRARANAIRLWSNEFNLPFPSHCCTDLSCHQSNGRRRDIAKRWELEAAAAVSPRSSRRQPATEGIFFQSPQEVSQKQTEGKCQQVCHSDSLIHCISLVRFREPLKNLCFASSLTFLGPCLPLGFTTSPKLVTALTHACTQIK